MGIHAVGRVLTLDDAPGGVQAAIGLHGAPAGEPVIRRRLRSRHCTCWRGSSLWDAQSRKLWRARKAPALLVSILLGEAARTHGDAERYRRAYLDAIGAIAARRADAGDRRAGDVGEALGTASALRPVAGTVLRAGAYRHSDRAGAGGQRAGIGLTIDAEEAIGWKSASMSLLRCWVILG